jgi:hypothetical protein
MSKLLKQGGRLRVSDRLHIGRANAPLLDDFDGL